MFLTIQTLFDDAKIVSAIIRRVNQTRKDTIYWQQYLTCLLYTSPSPRD